MDNTLYRIKIQYRGYIGEYYTEAPDPKKALSNALFRFHCENPRLKHLGLNDVNHKMMDPDDRAEGERPPIPPPTARPPHQHSKGKPSQGRFGFMGYQDFSDFHDKT